MKDLLTTRQAADQLGIGRQRVIQLIAQKILPAEKIGSCYLILKKDLKYAEKRNTKPGRTLGKRYKKRSG